MSSADRDNLKIFCGRASRDLAESICRFLDLPLGQGHTDMFPDGELIVKLEEDVRGRDCFVVQSTYHPVNAHLMELLIYIDCLKRASARRITAVLPYFGYARQDRKDEGRTPITAKLVANLITEAGADRVLAVDLHAAQIQGFFDVPVDHLYAAPVLNNYFASLGIPEEDMVVVSPDLGSIKRARGHAERLCGRLAIVDKRRTGALETRQENIIGSPVKDKVCLMFDDMISTASSICGAAERVHAAGAKEIHVAATHGVLCGPAIERLKAAPIKQVVITDTIPLRPEQQLPKIKVLPVAPLLGEAIKRIHRNESVSRLFD